MNTSCRNIAAHDEMVQLGQDLARACTQPQCFYITGVVGAGKTTLIRAMLRAWGITGAVVSPTFSLLECYQVSSHTWLHMDLYRLTDLNELRYLGLDEYPVSETYFLIEWAEAHPMLPAPDWQIHIDVQDEHRIVHLHRTAL